MGTTTQPSILVRKGWMGLIFGLAALTIPSQAAISYKLSSAVIESPAVILEPDFFDGIPATNRHQVPASVNVIFGRKIGDPAIVGTFRVAYSVVDPDNNKVKLETTGPDSFEAYSASFNINVSGAQTDEQETVAINFDPTEILATAPGYRLVTKLQVFDGTNWNFINIADGVSPEEPILHFTQKFSNDTSWNIKAMLTEVEWDTTVMVTGGTPSGFQVSAEAMVGRYDEFDFPIDNVGSVLEWDFDLRVAGSSNQIALLNDGIVQQVYKPDSYEIQGGRPFPVVIPDASVATTLVPQTQLDSVNGDYVLSCTLRYLQGNGSNFVDLSELDAEEEQVMQFNGNLTTAGVGGLFDEISNTPVRGVAGLGYVETQIQIPAGAGSLPGVPELEFGSNDLLTVRLKPNGDAAIENGFYEVTRKAAPASPWDGMVGSYPVVYGDLSLSGGGLTANGLTVAFGQGTVLMETLVQRDTKRGQSSYTFPGPAVLLDANAQLATNLNAVLPADSEIASEEFPLITEVSDLTLTQSGGLHFTPVATEYIHQDALALLEDEAAMGLHNDAAMKVRKSNDGYFRSVDGVSSSEVGFTLAPDGTSRFEGIFSLTQGQFEPHFPTETTIVWTGGTSQLVLENGEVANGSQLTLPNDITIDYQTTCEEDFCAGDGAVSFVLDPVSLTLGFVEGGGLIADGFIDPNQKVEWGARGDGMGGTGEPTHEVSPGGFGYFFMPGQHLYAADNTLVNHPWLSHQAAVQSPDLLLNANSTLPAFPPAVTSFSLPGSTAAIDGEGLFGGINFLGLPNNELATSRLGGGEMDYLLQGDSKYYARYSGITGRHLAAPGSYQPTEIYGYGFDFSKFEMTFLSSKPRLTWVNGQLSVDGATTFTQKFIELSMNCTGDLGPAELDPTDLGDKPLIYWGGQFTPRTMTFAKGTPVDPCGTPPAKLVFGSTVSVSNVPTPLHAPIGIENDGRLTTIATAFEGVDSRFGIPARIEYGADGSVPYSLVPSGKLYFNNPTEDEIDGPGVPSGGFATFGCSINVPYFRNLFGQAITYPSGVASVSGNSLLYLAPGWNAGGQTFFTNTEFDPTCDGWPRGAIEFADYREPDDSVADQFLIKASQKMFGLVDLSYPLRWDAGGFFFESMDNQADDLFVATLDHEVSFLDAQFADISFGASYDGLPRIRLGDILNEQVNEVSEVMTQALSGSIGNQPGGILKGAIDGGMQGFDKLLGDTFETALADKLAEIEGDVLENLYENIAISYSVDRQVNLDIEAGLLPGPVKTFEEWRDGDLSDILDAALFDVDSSTGELVDSLNSLGDGIEEAHSFLGEVDQVVLDLIAMIDTLVNQVQIVDGRVAYVEDVATIPAQDIVRGLLQEFEPLPGEEPARVFFSEMVKLLLIEMTPPEVRVVIEPLLVAGANEFIDELNGLLDEIEPALARLVAALNQVRAVLVELHDDLEEGQGIATVFGDLVSGAASELNDISATVRATAEGIVNGMAASSGLQFDAGLHLGTELFVTGNGNLEVGDLGQRRFVEGLGAALRDELLGSELIRQFRFQSKQIFFDLEARVATAMQSIFSQANEVMSGLVKSALGGVDDSFNEFLGTAGDFIGSGDLEGFARIRGDSLRQLRLDGNFQFKIPEEMELHAYMEVNNVTAEDNFTENGCLSPGQRAVEIKVGATDVGIDWFADDLRAELVELRVSLKDFDEDPFDFPIPNGMGGTFIIDGGFDFQGFDVSNVRGTFGLAVDPEFPLNSECYIGGGASMELSSYGVTGAIFFGRTCTLEPLRLVDPDLADLLGAAPFTGGYLYGETHLPISEALLGIPASCLFEISADLGAGAFFFVEGPVFGGKMAAGVSGEALCAVSIGGRVDMIGLMDEGKMKYSGTGSVRGKAGPCPFCLRYSKSIKVTYRDGAWSVDF